MYRLYLIDYLLLIVLLLVGEIQMASLPPVYKHGCVFFADQHIYCFGGALRTKPTGIASQTYFDDDQLYNQLMSLDISKPLNVSAANTQWQTIAPISPQEARADFAIMAFGAEGIEIAGGIGSGINKSVINITMSYYPKENKWKGEQQFEDSSKQFYNTFDTLMLGQRDTKISETEYAVFGGMPNDNNTVIRSNTTFVHVISSDTTWVNNITAGTIPTFRNTDMIPDYARRSRGAIAAGMNSEVFIFGGVMPLNASDNYNYQADMAYTDLSRTLAYQTQTHDFKVTQASIPSPGLREFHTATTIPKVNKIILYGGINSVEILRDFCWLFDVTNHGWQTVQFTNGNGPGPRFGHQAVMVGDEMLYIIGGMDAVGAIQNDVHILNVTSMTWLNGSFTNTYEQMMDNQPVETTPSAPLSAGAIAGIVIGCVAGVAILVTSLVIIYIQRKKKAMTRPVDAPEGLMPEPVMVEHDKVKPDTSIHDDKVKPDALPLPSKYTSFKPSSSE